MAISATLSTHLSTLTQALDEPGVDLEVCLHDLVGDVKRAVESYTGLTMTIMLEGSDVRFTVNDAAASDVATSLHIPLAAVTDTGPGSTLLLYAAAPGAFVDLAADLSHALGIPLTALVLDGDLDPPTSVVGIASIEDRFALDRAIGILIDRGHTPDAARRELHRLAAAEQDGLRAAADVLIVMTSAHPTDASP